MVCVAQLSMSNMKIIIIIIIKERDEDVDKSREVDGTQKTKASLFVSLLSGVPATCNVYFKNRSAGTILRAAAPD